MYIAVRQSMCGRVSSFNPDAFTFTHEANDYSSLIFALDHALVIINITYFLINVYVSSGWTSIYKIEYLDIWLHSGLYVTKLL